jgi:hypothetical protein
VSVIGGISSGMQSVLPPPDDDVAQAVLAQWNGIANGDPFYVGPTGPQTLAQLVPGSLQRKPLSSFQPNTEPKVARAVPYADFEVKKARDGLHQSSGPYVDYRLITVEIFGLKATVTQALSSIRAAKLFNRATLRTAAQFLLCKQLEGDDLKPAEASQPRAGETLWIGTIQLEVWTARPE